MRRAPDDPAQLPARGHRADHPQRAHHDHESGDEGDREIQQLRVPARTTLTHVSTFAVRGAVDHARDRNRAEQQRRQVDRVHERAPGIAAHPRVRAIREHQRKVQEERRQQEHRRQVAPVERPVERVELAGERERHHAEKGDGQPEEMERRLVIGTPQPHRGADQQREDADGGQREIEAERARGHRRDLDRHLLPRLLSHDQVAERGSGRARVEHVDDVLHALNLAVADLQQDVAARQPRALTRRAFRDLRRRDLAARDLPQHAVLELGPRRALHHVQSRQAQQRRRR